MRFLMRFLIRKSLLVAGSFLVAMGQAGVASAHNQGESFTTGRAAAVDFYQVTCFDDGSGLPDHLMFGVKDLTANTAKVSVLVQKGTSCSPTCAKSTTDTNDNDTEYSGLVRVKQGSGVYNMFVSHTAAGTDSYDVQYHCETSTGVHTGTNISAQQQM
jgi:hypothetical protein